MINAQINPELNRRWAEDLEKGEVDKEIELIISRSRENSIVNQLKEKGAFDVQLGVGIEPEPSGDPSPVGRTRRSNSLATISELPRRNRGRTRTVSYSPQVCTLWIGHWSGRDSNPGPSWPGSDPTARMSKFLQHFQTSLFYQFVISFSATLQPNPESIGRAHLAKFTEIKKRNPERTVKKLLPKFSRNFGH